MPWPWVVMERAELDRLKAELEACHESMWESQLRLTQEREARFMAENKVKALEAIIEVKEQHD